MTVTGLAFPGVVGDALSPDLWGAEPQEVMGSGVGTGLGRQVKGAQFPHTPGLISGLRCVCYGAGGLLESWFCLPFTKTPYWGHQLPWRHSLPLPQAPWFPAPASCNTRPALGRAPPRAYTGPMGWQEGQGQGNPLLYLPRLLPGALSLPHQLTRQKSP